MNPGTCKHYCSPIHYQKCGKGINYREIAGGEEEGYLARLPCVKDSILNKDQVSCELYEEPTKEEVKEFNKKVMEQLLSGMGFLDSGGTDS